MQRWTCRIAGWADDPVQHMAPRTQLAAAAQTVHRVLGFATVSLGGLALGLVLWFVVHPLLPDELVSINPPVSGATVTYSPWLWVAAGTCLVAGVAIAHLVARWVRCGPAGE